MTKTETRYLVEWTPWSDVKAAAEAKGWTPADSAADFVEVDSFTMTRWFHGFGTAVVFARSMVEADTWACPRIRRQILEQNDTDDLGRKVKAMPQWETDANWEVAAGDPDPVEAEPHWQAAA